MSESGEKQTWYVTKYWETNGIEECEGYVKEGGHWDDEYLKVTYFRGDRPFGSMLLTPGKEAFANVTGAQFRVIELAERKLKSLAKKKARISSLVEQIEADMDRDADLRIQERHESLKR